MASTNSSTPASSTNPNLAITTTTANINTETTTSVSPEESAAKSVHKRYEGLVMVRTKAVKGKGAWYWAHLEPILVHNSDTGLPKAVKLRCSLCDAVFSASNPSRTASEHLKRGTCPNFHSTPTPISSISPCSTSVAHRKRHSLSIDHHPQLPTPTPTATAGGKDDLAPLAMLEDSVKRLKSPKTSPGPALTRAQVESAVELLSDWVYESCGSVSLSSLDHPKFRAFLHQVGVPAVSRREIAGARLDRRYEEARAESEVRVRDAMFFQVGSNGWKSKGNGDERVVNVSVNLPNGTSLYRRALFISGSVPSEFAEDVLREEALSGGGQRCVGIVADRFKSKALKRLEAENEWMVNLPCQLQAFKSLLTDITTHLPLFKSATESCSKLVLLINSRCHLRTLFHKLYTQEYGSSWGRPALIRGPNSVVAMLEDVVGSERAIQTLIREEDLSEMAAELDGFWPRVQAAHSLAKIATEMSSAVETDGPLVGQCLPLWDEMRSKMREWRAKFKTNDAAERLLEKRFRKNYHPAWAAAFILDPLYLVRDSTGKYLPPFKCLSSEQEKDVDRLITRLVRREEAHIAVMELMKWRTEGLEEVYARAVQMKERDPATGKMRMANPHSSRLVWETHLTHFTTLPKVAVRLIFLRATSAGFRCNSAILHWVKARPTAAERAQRLVFVAAHSRPQPLNDHADDPDPHDDHILVGASVPNGEDDVLLVHHHHAHHHHTPSV